MPGLTCCRLFRSNNIQLLNKNYNKNVNIIQKCFYSIDWELTEIPISLSNGRKKMSLGTGRMSKAADGFAQIKMGDTWVVATCVSKSHTASSSGFLPLTVDYQTDSNAVGKKSFSRAYDILTSRVIDRNLRPFFPNDYRYDIQIDCELFADDTINDPDILAINAASAALAVSDIPWNGPVAAVRVGLIDNTVVIMPTRDERRQSSLDIIVGATSGNLLVMLDGSAKLVPLSDVKRAIRQGIKACQDIIPRITELQTKRGKTKRAYEPAVKITQQLRDSVKSLSEIKLRDIFTNYTHDKASRDEAISNLKSSVFETMMKSVPDLDLTAVGETFNSVSKDTCRELIFESGRRCDGRKLAEIREIICETGLNPALHGSALFQRGQTQVFCSVTLDSLYNAVKLDRLSMLMRDFKEKKFFLNYKFPASATNEIKKSGPPGRREVGHGALGEKGLMPIIPDDYPFTIELNSKVRESNGSSSMATICGGTLALLDAGIEISSPAAGVAMGVVTKYSKDVPDKIEEYRILTDLLGIEDYFGDMDFKIAGTDKAITSLQADIKIQGMPWEIINESMDRAHEAKMKIINIMNATLAKPRLGKPNMPVTEVLEVPAYLRRQFLGSGGMNIDKIYVETGVTISNHDEDSFLIFAPNEMAMKNARKIIDEHLTKVTTPDLIRFRDYHAVVKEIRDYGLMVALYPNMKPILLPIQQLDKRQVTHPSELDIKVGDKVIVKYIGLDSADGRINISRKLFQFNPDQHPPIDFFGPQTKT